MLQEIEKFIEQEENALAIIKGDNETGALSFEVLLKECTGLKDKIYLSKENLRHFSQDSTGSWNAMENWYSSDQKEEKILTLLKLEESLKEKRESTNETAQTHEKENFYNQFILTTDKTNRPWLESNQIQEDDLFFSYFNAKFCILKETRDEFLKLYQKQKPSFEHQKEALSSQQCKCLKQYLDSSQDIFRFFKSLQIKKKEDQHALFEHTIGSFVDSIKISHLYNKSRNFLTKKPYSQNKFKLNFENSTLANGWDANKENDNSSVLLRKEDQYFLAIMDKSNNQIFQKCNKQ